MGMFFDVLSAINNPNQQGSIDQLESLTNVIQQTAAERGIPASQLQSVMSALGGFLGPALQQQANLPGGGGLEGMLGQLAGGSGAGAAALQNFIPASLQQQIIEGIAQKTGISPNTLQGMLPTVLPAVMGLLNMGNSTNGGGGGNAILNSFLNNDSNDLGDVLKFASRFLNPPQA